MASANNDSGIPSLSALVLPCRNNSQRYSDGLPKIFVGQKQLPAATATCKHRHGTLTMHREFT
jgi:hypothetical protein